MIIKTTSLTPQAYTVIYNKGTEPPYTGQYDTLEEIGTYLCRNCGLALFRSTHKFHSGCGWASFDQEIINAIKHQPDSDGTRIEILCKRCNAHLGHIFHGEQFTALNTRYCVNSLSLDFITNTAILDTEEAILAAGCFWGVEYYLQKLPGVLKTEVGYIGGNVDNPNYQMVCKYDTGHLEAVRVIYDPTIITYEQIIKYFFEIHDPTQTNGQGPDIGAQYQSAIFYYNQDQLQIAQSVISLLTQLEPTHKVVTKLMPVSIFWIAEDYHQDYYHKKDDVPYCHSWQKKF